MIKTYTTRWRRTSENQNLYERIKWISRTEKLNDKLSVQNMGQTAARIKMERQVN
jgi:hypothetical protein